MRYFVLKKMAPDTTRASRPLSHPARGFSSAAGAPGAAAAAGSGASKRPAALSITRPRVRSGAAAAAESAASAPMELPHRTAGSPTTSRTARWGGPDGHEE